MSISALAGQLAHLNALLGIVAASASEASEKISQVGKPTDPIVVDEKGTRREVDDDEDGAPAAGRPLGALFVRGRAEAARQVVRKAEQVQKSVDAANDRLTEMFGQLHAHERQLFERIGSLANEHHNGADLLRRASEILRGLQKAYQSGKGTHVYQLRKELDQLVDIINMHFLGQMRGIRRDTFLNLAWRKPSGGQSTGVLP